MYPLAKLQWQCRRIRCQDRMKEPLLFYFVKHNYGGNSFFGRPYVSSICSIFSLCMESKELEKKDFLHKFLRWFSDSMDSQNLRGYRSISSKAGLIFLENFLKFMSDTIKKQGIRLKHRGLRQVPGRGNANLYREGGC